MRNARRSAATVPAATVLRTLDAIHIASAQTLGAELLAVVTYDERMIRAVDGLGLATATPG